MLVSVGPQIPWSRNRVVGGLWWNSIQCSGECLPFHWIEFWNGTPSGHHVGFPSPKAFYG